jgi:uncharacterized membrane protein
MTQQRLDFPDLLKGIAVILMIQVHITENFATPEFYSSLAGKISLFAGGPAAAPLFMVVMGFFIRLSKKSLFFNLKRGLILIGAGLLLNTGRALHLLILISNGTSQLNPWKFIFGVDILFLAGLSIIIISLLQILLKSNLFWWIIVMLAVATINSHLPVYSGSQQWIKYLQAFFSGYFSWSFFPVFPWMAYALLGYIFCIMNERWKLSAFTTNTTLWTAVVLLVIIVFNFYFGFRVSSLLNIYYHHDLRFFLWTTAFLLFWVILIKFAHARFGNTKFSTYLIWIGKNVTAFYIVQWLIIGNLTTAIYKTQEIWTLPFWFLGILLATSLLVAGYLMLQRQSVKLKTQF